jgi:sirohydrochlorin cobaltochelatase
MLVGHGTRDEEGTRQFFSLGRQLAEQLHPLDVRPCLLEFQVPTLQEAWHELVERGVSSVHVAPLLLFAAGHAKSDIPSIIERCRRETPDVTWDQSKPLSRHPSLIELACRRIRGLADSSRWGEPTALVMVGRGSHDPCAQADMRVLTELVAHRLGIRSAFTAFYAMADPCLPDVLDRVGRSGRFGRVLVYPHLLFAGRLYQAIGKQVDDALRRHPSIDFALSRYLGPDPLVVRAIAARIGQAIDHAVCGGTIGPR